MTTNFISQTVQGPNGKLSYIKPSSAQIGNTMPGVMFIHGFASDKGGSKATRLMDICRERGQGFISFDCTAHGESDGDMKTFTLSQALDDVLFMLDKVCDRPQIIIGSSMGGWLALRAAEKNPKKIAGIIGLAAAPDFTKEIEDSLSEQEIYSLETQGYFTVAHDYGPDPYIFSKALLEDGHSHTLLERPIKYDGPVRLIQGMEDPAVRWQKALMIEDKLATRDCRTILIEDGDHSLSRDTDIKLIDWAIRDIIAVSAGRPQLGTPDKLNRVAILKASR